MRITTWNVNSIKARLPLVLAWLQAHKPDVLLMQEIKCETAAFPAFEFEAMGYKLRALGQKSYNGVALLSLHPLEDVLEHLPEAGDDTHARYLEATVQGIRIASLYLPNGDVFGSDKFVYKMAWMERLNRHAASLLKSEQPVVLGGDYNIIPESIDLYDPKGWEMSALFHAQSRASFRRIVDLGYTEAFRALHPGLTNAYSFWDYQSGAWQRDNGLRIDHFLLSPEAADRLAGCTIDREERSKDKASDHVPVTVELR